MVNRKSKKMLPHFKDLSELADRFADFFVEKISRLWTNLNNGNENSPREQLHSVPRLSDFEPTNSIDICFYICSQVLPA